VATPSACPSGTNGTTTGRSSPWAGTIDVSVFVAPKAPARRVRLLGELIRGNPLVRTTYFESSSQAFAEFQRLYTCWASVARSQTPASYRLVLSPTATVNDRNQLVNSLVSQPDVESVSCAPALPCTTQTATPRPASSSP
jgi:cell division protein FtsX